MKTHLPHVALAVLGVALGACSGSFGSAGTAQPGGVNPPVNPQGGIGQPYFSPSPMVSGAVSPAPSAPPGKFATYALADVAKSVKCPTDKGYSCTLQLPFVSASPSAPPDASPSASASASPSPSSSVPASALLNASPSPTPAGPQLSVTLTGNPTDAPKMVNPNPKAVSTIALVELHLRTDADATMSGKASADFSLPKEQIGGRGFAIQLFYETLQKKKRVDKFIGNYNVSKLVGDSILHFAFDMKPAVQVKNGENWLIVLYGDELPPASPSVKASSSAPSPSPSASSSAFPSGSPSSSASP
jgi:hypothetical protein